MHEYIYQLKIQELERHIEAQNERNDTLCAIVDQCRADRDTLHVQLLLTEFLMESWRSLAYSCLALLHAVLKGEDQ